MRRRIVIYSIFLALLTALTGFGFYNLVRSTVYKNNEVQFVVNNEEAYFIADASYYYGEGATASNLYHASYLQEDYYRGESSNIAKWNIGTSEFVINDTDASQSITELKYVINIANKNEKRNLKVNLSKVAMHKDVSFITEIKYAIGDNAEEVVFSNEPSNRVHYEYYNETASPTTVSIGDDAVLGIGKSMQITITLSLNTKTKAFTFSNNFVITLDSIAQ